MRQVGVKLVIGDDISEEAYTSYVKVSDKEYAYIQERAETQKTWDILVARGWIDHELITSNRITNGVKWYWELLDE